jgi:DNA polymerase III epsilon subunit-like protein
MIVLDIETTGWEFVKHGIIGIGALDFEDPSNQFYGECCVRKDAILDPEASVVHGMSEEQLRDPKKQSEESLIRAFDAWANHIPDKTLAGHNVGFFDRGHLQAAYARYRLVWPYSRRTVDLHTLAYTELRKKRQPVPRDGEVSGLSLDIIAVLVGLPKEPQPHVAINGAKYEAEAFSRLLFRKNLLPEFKKYPVKE